MSARKSPCFAQPIAVMFRNRPAEQAHDELHARLKEIDDLAGDE